MTPWTVGLHRRIRNHEGRPMVWSHREETRIPIDVVTIGEQTLVLDGLPAPSPDGDPQTVEVLLGGTSLGTVEWSEAARRELDIPEGVLRPGRHELTFRYRYIETMGGSGPDLEDRAMAWHRVEMRVSSSDGELDGTDSFEAEDAVQVAPAVWWRDVPASWGVDWRARGEAVGGGTRVALWLDDGSGEWSVLDGQSADDGEEISLVHRVEPRPGAMMRLGVAVTAGAVRWQGLSTALNVPVERRPLVLVTLDTTRRDALGPYASDVVTPNLDRLASEGVVWEQAYSPTPTTAPTHASLFLSRYPAQHGLRTNGLPLPRADFGHLVQQAKALDYETAGFISIGVVAADRGFDLAFDDFDDDLDHHWWRFATAVNERALPWIAEHPQRPNRRPGFLWVHYSDPHKPYGTVDELGQGLLVTVNGVPIDTVPTVGLDHRLQVQLEPGLNLVELTAPREFDDDRVHWYIGRAWQVSGGGASIELGDGWDQVRSFPQMRRQSTLKIHSSASEPRQAELMLRLEDLLTEEEARRRYAQEVTAMDEALGRLLEQLRANGWLDRGLVMIVADHGEDLGEGGHFGHVHHVGPTLSHIPMILWGKGLEPRRITEPVSVIDVAPTLWARLGLDPSPHWSGVDAFDPPLDRPIYLETFPPEADQQVRGVLQADLAIVGTAGERPDTLWVDAESGLRRPVADGELSPVQARQAEALNRAWAAWIGAASESHRVAPEVEERLRALGYVQ